MPDFGSLAQRVLGNAANKLGGTTELARYLGVPEYKLESWKTGKEVPPTDLVLRAVNLLLDEPKN